MVVYYFGADSSWENLQLNGFNRRNTCILQALAESDHTRNIYNVRFVSRINAFKKILFQHISKNKIRDVFFCNLFPGSYKFIFYINQAFARILIRYQTGHYNSKGDLIWFYWPQAYKNVKLLELDGRIIFDADHNLIDDPNLSVSDKKNRVDIITNISSTADILIASTRSMLSWWRNNGFINTYRLRNGIDKKRFVNDDTVIKYFNNSRPVIGYCGTLSRWIDTSVLFKLITEHPEWNFLIAGADYMTSLSQQLENLDNVLLLGKVSAAQVPSVIKSFNVALALYKSHPALDVDSMKIYEYLAAGKPVVSLNFHDNLKEDFNGQLYLADDYYGVEKNIKSVLSNRIELNRDIESSWSWLSRVDVFLDWYNFKYGQN